MVSRPGHKLKITLLAVADVLSNGSAEVRMLFDNLASKVCCTPKAAGCGIFVCLTTGVHLKPNGSIGMNRVSPLDLGMKGVGPPVLDWYRPGTCLTEWTGDIPDTATMAGLSLKRADAMENEQCDGREAAVCI
jgi:hypothetical protein